MKGRDLAVLLGLGAAGGVVTAVLGVRVTNALSAAAMAIASGTNDWILGGILLAGLLVVVLPVSGGVAGLLGGLASGWPARRIWRASQRWLWAWLIVWAVGGAGLGLTVSNPNAELGLSTAGLGVLLGALIALGFAFVAPPWTSRG
ncbi:MAG: hypothetical protein NZP34_09010 [Caldilineales bacterium]|nr:hypothetical protein [Caldilineales bacterium]